MKHKPPYLFADFTRACDQIVSAFSAVVTYLLLCGESGAGKTELLEHLGSSLDRCFYRIVYFCQANLNPSGLVRVLAQTLRIPIRRTLSETIHAIAKVLAEEPGLTLVWLDEAHSVPDETLALIRTLAEARLGHKTYISVLLVGLPSLRTRLQSPHLMPLWRRLQRRIELTGLRRDEARSFIAHVFGKKNAHRINNDALSLLFEHSRGLPGLIDNYLDVVLREYPEGRINAEIVQSVIQQWDLA